MGANNSSHRGPSNPEKNGQHFNLFRTLNDKANHFKFSPWEKLAAWQIDSCPQNLGENLAAFDPAMYNDLTNQVMAAFRTFQMSSAKGQHFALFWYQNLKVRMALRMFSLNGQNLPLFDTKILPKDRMAPITYSPKLATYNKFDKWTVVKKPGEKLAAYHPAHQNTSQHSWKKICSILPCFVQEVTNEIISNIPEEKWPAHRTVLHRICKGQTEPSAFHRKMGSILHRFFGGSKLQTWSNPKFSKDGQHFALFYIEHCKGEMALKIFTEKMGSNSPC